MSDFNESAWAQENFSRNYLERADIYIVERQKMFSLVSSFYRHFLMDKRSICLLDLGAGDGMLSHELLKVGGFISATVVDGSEAMIRKAEKRLAEFRDVMYIRASFQELLSGAVPLNKGYNLVVSSLAIHHLSLGEKEELFRYIQGHLGKGGYFVNLDVVRAPSACLEGWYFALWRSWMERMQTRLELKDESTEEIIERYKDPASANRPDSLEDQLDALKKAGFQDVDCYYKNGLFAVFGGKKG